jgi:hypothetical protein
MPIVQHPLEAYPVTSGPKFHWFGYYDKFPWDATGRYMLCLEVDFMDRAVAPTDVATIGMIDLQDNNRFIPLAQTQAFNWQQGTHLQWLGSAPDRKIIYNSLAGDHYVSIIQDVFTGEKTELPRPIYAITRDGTKAITLNFSRVHQNRPGYGYNHLMELAGPPVTDKDGLWVMDLATGESQQIVSIQQAYDYHTRPDFVGARHWFNHLQFNPAGTRSIFLHRWKSPQMRTWLTRLYTVGADGSNLCLVNDDDMTSHFDWCGSDRILAWATQRDRGNHYYLFTDLGGPVDIVGEDVFTTDGHCSYSPDGRWILTDTYPDAEKKRTLILYRIADNTRIDVGRFYSVPTPDPEWRCDLHPRWSRDGRQICFDSTHTGSRQMYVMDVSEVVNS